MVDTNISKAKAAETLRALREKKGLSQTEVAEALGIPATTYNAYETGQNIPRYEMMFRISEYFGRSVQYIFFQKDTH